ESGSFENCQAHKRLEGSFLPPGPHGPSVGAEAIVSARNGISFVAPARSRASDRLQLLADALPHPEAAGLRLLLRLPVGREAGAPAHGQRRAHAGAGVAARGRGRGRLALRRIRPVPESLL